MGRLFACLEWISGAFASASDVGLVSFIAAVLGGVPALAIYVSPLAQVLAGFLLFFFVIPFLALATICGTIAMFSSQYSRAVPGAALLIVGAAIGPYAIFAIMGP